MRLALVLSCLIVPAVLGCRSAAPGSGFPVRVPSPPVDLARTTRAFRDGSVEAEGILVAAGPGCAPYLRPLLEDGDPVVRARAADLLLSLGEDIDLTERERLALRFEEVAAPERIPFHRLKALGKLHERPVEVRALLTEEAGGDGPRAEAARRLLKRWSP